MMSSSRIYTVIPLNGICFGGFPCMTPGRCSGESQYRDRWVTTLVRRVDGGLPAALSPSRNRLLRPERKAPLPERPGLLAG